MKPEQKMGLGQEYTPAASGKDPDKGMAPGL